MIRKLHYSLQDIKDYCDSMNETPESFMHSILSGAIKIDEANKLIGEYVRIKNLTMSEVYSESYDENTKCTIDDLHYDVNWIYEQHDEGNEDYQEIKKSLIIVCEAFLRTNKKEK